MKLSGHVMPLEATSSVSCTVMAAVQTLKLEMTLAPLPVLFLKLCMVID